MEHNNQVSKTVLTQFSHVQEMNLIFAFVALNIKLLNLHHKKNGTWWRKEPEKLVRLEQTN